MQHYGYLNHIDKIRQSGHINPKHRGLKHKSLNRGQHVFGIQEANVQYLEPYGPPLLELILQTLTLKLLSTAQCGILERQFRS